MLIAQSNINVPEMYTSNLQKLHLVQLVGPVEVTSRYFLTGRCHSSKRFDSREKTVCKMGQTGHAEFIRLSCIMLCFSLVIIF